MPILYEPEPFRSKETYILKGKLSRPLFNNEVKKLHNAKSLIEQKADIRIHKIETTPNSVLIYYSQRKTQRFIIPFVAIAIIAAAVSLPITAWLVTRPPPGPAGLPMIFWVGLGIGIPIVGLGIILIVTRKK